MFALSFTYSADSKKKWYIRMTDEKKIKEKGENLLEKVISFFQFTIIIQTWSIDDYNQNDLMMDDCFV